MFQDRPANPHFEKSVAAHGLEIEPAPNVIAADVVLFPNPSCLKFNSELNIRITCDRLIVITHENALLTNGTPAFDMAACLALIDNATIARRKCLAPVSEYNRETVVAWAEDDDALPPGWMITENLWTNICTLPMAAPTASPSDRRGRLSRPGFEKFPDDITMQRHFPPQATNVILGGDIFLADAPPHWQVLEFRSLPVDRFFERIDFFVYYTNQLWRESFGRVLMEAIAAGKMVITDPETARNIGADIPGTPVDQVDRVIAQMISSPGQYQKTVYAMQKNLETYRPQAFLGRVRDLLAEIEP